ncbi:DNA-directed RNA polymerase I subunit [Balamuthia mandrillaris]
MSATASPRKRPATTSPAANGKEAVGATPVSKKAKGAAANGADDQQKLKEKETEFYSETDDSEDYSSLDEEEEEEEEEEYEEEEEEKEKEKEKEPQQEEAVSSIPGYVQLGLPTSQVDYDAIANNEVELWLIKAPSDFEGSGLRNAKLQHGDLATTITGGTKPVTIFEHKNKSYSLGVTGPEEHRQLLNLFGRKGGKRLLLGKPFARSLTVMETVNVPSAPTGADIQIKSQIQQQTNLRLRFRPPGYVMTKKEKEEEQRRRERDDKILALIKQGELSQARKELKKQQRPSNQAEKTKEGGEENEENEENEEEEEEWSDSEGEEEAEELSDGVSS